MPILLGVEKPNTPAWYALRRDGLGSSDIAALLGESKYGTPYSVWVDKTATDTPVDKPNRWQEWGSRLEAVVAEKFADDHPEFLVNDCGTYMAEGRPWQRANPDRLILDLATAEQNDVGWRGPIHALLEVKTGARPDLWEDGVPALYRSQCIWQADVMDVDTVYVAALLGGSDYREYRIDVTEFDKAHLRSVGEAFWFEHVVPLIPPPLDGDEETLRAVWSITPPVTDESVVLPDDLADRFVLAKQYVDEAAAHFNEVKAEILLTLGDAKHGVRGDGTKVALRKEYPKSGIDLKALRAAHPAIVEEFATSTLTRSVEVAAASRPSKGDS
jgi:putative phage-type endonuclease